MSKQGSRPLVLKDLPREYRSMLKALVVNDGELSLDWKQLDHDVADVFLEMTHFRLVKHKKKRAVSTFSLTDIGWRVIQHSTIH